MRIVVGILIGALVVCPAKLAAQTYQGTPSQDRPRRRESLGASSGGTSEVPHVAELDEWMHSGWREPALDYVVPRQTPPLQNLMLLSETPPEDFGEYFNQSGLSEIEPPGWRFLRLRQVGSDYSHFYSRDNLLDLGCVLAVGAVLANTPMDEHFREFFQTNISTTSSDEWSESLHLNKEIGNGIYSLPVLLAAASLPYLPFDNPVVEDVGLWGNRGLRIFVLGAPALVVGQMVTGGSRPGETVHGSDWHFWQDNNGVSGHAFMGAIPFLAASELTDNRLWGGFCVAASTLPGLSRINDDDHYVSQVLLGWTLAYLSYRAVSRTDLPEDHWKLSPWQAGNAQGIGLETRW